MKYAFACLVLLLVGASSVDALFLRPIPQSQAYVIDTTVTNAKIAPCNITFYRFTSANVIGTTYLKVQLNTTQYCNKGTCPSAATPRPVDTTVGLWIAKSMTATPAAAIKSCTGACELTISCSYGVDTYYIAVAGGVKGISIYNLTTFQRNVNLGPQISDNLAPSPVYGTPTIVPNPAGSDAWNNYTNVWSNFTDPAPCLNQKPCDPINGNMYWRISWASTRVGEFMTVYLSNLKVSNAAVDTTKFVMRLLKGSVPVAAQDEQEACVGSKMCVKNFEKHEEKDYVYDTCQCSPDYKQPGTGTLVNNYCNMTVSPCYFSEGDWYLGLNYPQTGVNFKFDFSVHANIFAPQITTLVKNQVNQNDQVQLGVDHHYKIVVPAGETTASDYLRVTVDNVVGGQVWIWVNPGSLAGSNDNPTAGGGPASGNGGPEGCNGNVAQCRTPWGCNVVVQKCDFAKYNAKYDGVWYIAVHVYSNTAQQRLPIDYRITATWESYAQPGLLVAGTPLFGTVGENLYTFYKFTVVPAPNTYLFVELYQDHRDTQLEFYMLQQLTASNGAELPGGHCYATDDAQRAFQYYCKTVAGTRASCNFMIPACELTAGTLYMSVYGTSVGTAISSLDNTYYELPVEYTLWADYDQPRQIVNETSYTETTYLNHYNHYFIYVDPEQYLNGDYFTVEYEQITGGSLQGYLQKDRLAGACPCWTNQYNCTGAATVPACIDNNGPPSTSYAPGKTNYCTITVDSCNFSPGLWYISAQGVVGAANAEIGYTLRATWWPKPAIKSLYTTQVENFKVGAQQYNHYVVEVDNSAVTTSSNNLAFKLVVQEFEATYAGRTLYLYVQRDQLATKSCFQYQCSAMNSATGYTYCTVKVPFCQLFNGTKHTFYASVYGQNAAASCCGPSTRYTLEAQLEPVAMNVLPNAEWTYGRVKEDRYVHYKFSTPGFTAAQTTYMYIELYLNNDQEQNKMSLSLYMNARSPAGGNLANRECFNYERMWNVTKGVSFMLQPCELENAPTDYYFSVYGRLENTGNLHMFFDRAQEYTFQVSLKTLPRALQLNAPLTGWVYAGDQYHYQVTVANSDITDATTGKPNWGYLEFSTSNVQFGTVTTWFNYERLAGACPCYTNIAQCPEDKALSSWCSVPPPALVVPVSNVLTVPNCVLKKQLGNYFYSVRGLTTTNIVPAGYSVKPSLKVPNYTEITSLSSGYVKADTLRLTFEPERYWHFAISSGQITNNTVLVVNISAVKDGSLQVFYNGPKQGYAAENWPGCYLRNFGTVTSKMVLQIEPCDFAASSTVYVSLRSASTKTSMFFEFTAYTKSPISLPLGGNGLNQVTLNQGLYEQYFLDVPAQTPDDATILSIQFKNVTRGGFTLMTTRDAPAGPPVDTNECLACTTTMWSSVIAAGGTSANQTVWNCKFQPGRYWMRLIPTTVSADKTKPDTFIENFKAQTINTNPSAVALAIGTGSANGGLNPGTGTFEQKIGFSWKQYTLELLPAMFTGQFVQGGKLRVKISPSGTGSLAFYINPALPANAGCNEWSCTSATCGATQWQVPVCCSAPGNKWFLGATVTAEPGGTFTVRADLIQEQRVNVAFSTPRPKQLVPFATTTVADASGVMAESYQHYRFNLPASSFANGENMVFNFSRPSGGVAGSLTAYVQYGYFAGSATESSGCYSNIKTCTVSPGNSAACHIQLRSCELREGDWFFSFYNPTTFDPTQANTVGRKGYVASVETQAPIAIALDAWSNVTYWGFNTEQVYKFEVTDDLIQAQNYVQVQLASVNGAAVSLTLCSGAPCGCTGSTTLGASTTCGGSGSGACILRAVTCTGAAAKGTYWATVALGSSTQSARYSFRPRVSSEAYASLTKSDGPVPGLSTRWSTNNFAIAAANRKTVDFWQVGPDAASLVTIANTSNLLISVTDVTAGRTVVVTAFNSYCQQWTCTSTVTTGPTALMTPSLTGLGCTIGTTAATGFTGRLTPCSAKGGNWFFRIDNAALANYTLSLTEYRPVVTPLQKATPIYAEVSVREWQHYSFRVANVSLGTVVTATIQAECGRVDSYINCGKVAGPGTGCMRYACTTADTANNVAATCTLQLDTCETRNSIYYISVRGNKQNWLDPLDKLLAFSGGNVNFKIGYIISVDWQTVTQRELSLCKANLIGAYENADQVTGGGSCDPRANLNNLNELPANPCNGNGQCSSGTCECNAGFTGARCETAIGTVTPTNSPHRLTFNPPPQQFFFDLENQPYSGLVTVTINTALTSAHGNPTVTPRVEMKRSVVAGELTGRCSIATFCGVGNEQCMKTGTATMSLQIPPCNANPGRYFLNVEYNDWAHIVITRTRPVGMNILNDVEYNGAVATSEYQLFKFYLDKAGGIATQDLTKNWRVLFYNVRGSAKVQFSSGAEPNWNDLYAGCPYTAVGLPNDVRECTATGTYVTPGGGRSPYWVTGHCELGLGPCVQYGSADMNAKYAFWWLRVTGLTSCSKTSSYTLRLASTVSLLTLDVGTYRCDTVGPKNGDWITNKNPNVNYYQIMPKGSDSVVRVDVSGMSAAVTAALMPGGALASPFLGKNPFTTGSTACSFTAQTDFPRIALYFYCKHTALTAYVQNQANVDQSYFINATVLTPQYSELAFGARHCESCPSARHGNVIGFDWYTVTTPATADPLTTSLFFQLQMLGKNAGTGKGSLSVNKDSIAGFSTLCSINQCDATDTTPCTVNVYCGVEPNTKYYLVVNAASGYCVSSGSRVAAYSQLTLIKENAPIPTTAPPTTAAPTTVAPTTVAPTTATPTTAAPTTAAPTTAAPTTAAPTTAAPTTAGPTTAAPTTVAPTTAAPTTAAPTAPPTQAPSTKFCYSWETNNELSPVAPQHWYKFTLAAADLTDDTRDFALTTSLRNVYGATVTATLNRGKLPHESSSDCRIQTGTVTGTSGDIVYGPCNLVAGDYYLLITWAQATCDAAPFKGSAQTAHDAGYCVSVTLSRPTPSSAIAITAGTLVSGSLADSNAAVWYRFVRATTDPFDIVQVQLRQVEGGAATATAIYQYPGCSTAKTCTSAVLPFGGDGNCASAPSCAFYMLSCEMGTNTDIFIRVSNAAPSVYKGVVTYELLVTRQTDYTEIGDGTPVTFPPASNAGNSMYGFYKVTTQRAQSVRVNAVVKASTDSSATALNYMTRTVWNAPCSGWSNTDQNTKNPQWQGRYQRTKSCYPVGTTGRTPQWSCEWESSTAIENWSKDNTYYFVFQTGTAEATITATTGEANCAKPPASEVSFCSFVDYNTWAWQDSSKLDDEAQCLYEQLKDSFWCTGCDCGYTELCDMSLRAMACYEVFKQCESFTGYQTKTCRVACEASAFYCRNWWESVDQPAWNCTSSRYADRTAQACTGASTRIILSPNDYTNTPGRIVLVE